MFHIRMLKKILQKADPELLNTFIQALIARIIIRIMHKTFIALKYLNLPISENDYQITQEISEYFQQYDPKIIGNSALNNTTFIGESSCLVDDTMITQKYYIY
ncbi:hypothetical protein IMG5_199300 [Ichthyophthirius multifiliis]|uniref:Uncharacterized protein n=1 Tax=Ichthyophthirius multifiliis TaxID=5932 RepID=G0R5J0_ICHMU|nr:hypothetical protein IMG5_199300 [Ichthyophthirius multifiliis]EGR27250.1 hypothetical protein IMG5_199300 [Ichthyophthirius multifiliis]|eukprot:XP_004024134.1 hypothetical protein IMG5_199300 [Ichthyophthirius multifiliis]